MEECDAIKATRAKISSWIWQSSVLELPLQRALLKESVTKRSASVRANARR
jgi:hypothetical protein